MGFFFEQSAADARSASRTGTARVVPIHLMQEQGCLACPQNEVDRRRNTPRMKPSGSDRPRVYVLDNVPTAEEDEHDAHLLGDAGDLVLAAIPRKWRQDIRVAHAVRCHPTSGTVGAREVVCCSKYTNEDIEAARPDVILGLGELPLRWALGDGAQDSVWRGRMWPVRVGHHVCWYYHVQSPHYIARIQKDRKFDSEQLVAFRKDIARLFDSILPELSWPPPYVDERDRMKDLECISGNGAMDLEHVEQWLHEALREPQVGVDIETSALRPYGTESVIATVSIATPRRSLAFPIHHPEGWQGSSSLRREVQGIVGEFLMQSNAKVCHNLSFEQEWFGFTYGKELLRRTEWDDSMAAAHTLDERPGALNLGAVTTLRFGFNVKKLSTVDVTAIMRVPLSKVLPYNALDSLWSLRALQSMWPTLEADDALMREYLRKIRLTPTLVRAQLRGVPVDLEYAAKMQETLVEEVATAKRLLARSREVLKFEERFGRTFQVTDDDVVALLRDVMGRDEGKRDGGRYSGDEATLSNIPPSAGIAPQQILAYRAANKLLGTYITPLLNTDKAKGTVLLHDDGLLHTNYNLMVAVTGRLSSDDPNLQNYPKRKRREVRGVIVAPPGHGIAAFDYGQLEARVIAMASEDRALVDAMWTSYDIHAFWAERFVHHYGEIKDWIVSEFDVDWDEKGMKTLRQEAKNKWVFPMFFGSSHRSCAKSLHVPEDVAEAIAEEFWDTFDGVKRWQKRLVAKYERDFYVETLGGRRRRGPMTLNEIINTPIQGTGADIVTDAQNKCSEYADVNMIEWIEPPINVHDDLSFLIPEDIIEEQTPRIARIMCDCRFSYVNVPIVVEAGRAAKHWHEVKEVAVYRSDEFGFHTR